jgi:hypothetical protein
MVRLVLNFAFLLFLVKNIKGPVEAAVHLHVDEGWSKMLKCMLTKLHKTKKHQELDKKS